MESPVFSDRNIIYGGIWWSFPLAKFECKSGFNPKKNMDVLAGSFIFSKGMIMATGGQHDYHVIF